MTVFLSSVTTKVLPAHFAVSVIDFLRVTSMQKQRYTLSDVYNAARRERHFNYVFWLHVTLDILGTYAMHGAGFCLVIFATILITMISALGFLVVLPANFEARSFWMACHSMWGVFVVFSIYFHYYMAVFTKPGSPGDAKDAGDAKSVDAQLEEGCCDQTLKLCKKCNYSKPKRTHHCSICNSCVLKMDHHCPWISNCVGYRNYRYFYGFLFWVTIGTMYVSVLAGYQTISGGLLVNSTTGKPGIIHRLFGSKDNNIYITLYDTLAGTYDMRHAAKTKKQQKNLRTGFKLGSFGTKPTQDTAAQRRLEGVTNEEWIAFPHHSIESQATPLDVTRLKRRQLGSSAESPLEALRVLHGANALDWLASEDMLLFLAFMMATGVCIGTSIMLSLHTFLVCNGYTTLEYFESDTLIKRCKEAGVPYKHPYDRGLSENIAEVFGPYPWYLMLLPSLREPPVVVFPSLPDLFPPLAQYTPYVPPAGPIPVMYNKYSTSNKIGTTAGAPRWERNVSAEPADDTNMEGNTSHESSQTLILDRPNETHESSDANIVQNGVSSRNNNASNSRRVPESSQSWNDKSK